MFSKVPLLQADSILGITTAFLNDPNPNKINLGVGAYRDGQGKPWVLPVVQEVEQDLVKTKKYNKEYLPITGLPEFCEVSRTLILGENSLAVSQNRVATIQSLSGTGALCLGFSLIKNFLNVPGIIYLSDPTWANHINMVKGAGLKLGSYRYYNKKTKDIDFEGMVEDLNNAPAGSVVLLHACCHNPTGVDPTREQWQRLLQLFKDKKLYPYFDCAYQGYATGDLDADAYAVRLFDQAGMEFMIAQSYAKNFGLYGERIGAFSLVADSPKTVESCVSQLSTTIRQIYSSPPRHGAEIVATALSNPELKKKWKEHVKVMAERILFVRQELYNELNRLKVPGTWEHITKQIGMFTYTGLSSEQVARLTDVHHVYLTKDGRISMAGLNSEKCKVFAAAVKEVIEATSQKKSSAKL